jgi:hypothetical protein
MFKSGLENLRAEDHSWGQPAAGESDGFSGFRAMPMSRKISVWWGQLMYTNWPRLLRFCSAGSGALDNVVNFYNFGYAELDS